MFIEFGQCEDDYDCKRTETCLGMICLGNFVLHCKYCFMILAAMENNMFCILWSKLVFCINGVRWGGGGLSLFV